MKMATKSLQCLILVLAQLLMLCYPTNSLGFRLSSTDRDTMPSLIQSDGELDLITRLKAIHPEQDYTDSIQRLDSLRSSEPSCFEIATVLIGSCESIGVKVGRSSSGTKDGAEALETLKNLFAARLAVCELVGVGASVPPQCSNIFNDNEVTTREHLNHHWFHMRFKANGGSAVDFSKIRPCFKALESRQQSWTSFSNNKQNAELWCRLGRDTIEKNEVLEISKSSVKIMGDASSKLSEALQRSAKSLADLKTFADATDAFLSQLLANLQNGNEKLNSLVEQFVLKLQSALSDALNSVQEVNSNMSDLSKNITDSGVAVSESLRKVSQDVIGGLAEAAASQSDALKSNNELVVKVKQDLQSIHIDSIQMITIALEEVFHRAHSSKEALASLRQTQDIINEHARDAVISLQTLGSGFDDLRLAQEAYVVNQSLYHQEMQYNQQITLALQQQNSVLAANNLAQAKAFTKLLSGFFGALGVMFRAMFRYQVPLLWLTCIDALIVILTILGCVGLKTAALLSLTPLFLFLFVLTVVATVPLLLSLARFVSHAYQSPPPAVKWIVMIIGVGALLAWRIRLWSLFFRNRRGQLKYPHDNSKPILDDEDDADFDGAPYAHTPTTWVAPLPPPGAHIDHAHHSPGHPYY